MNKRAFATIVIVGLSAFLTSCRNQEVPTEAAALPPVESTLPRKTVTGEWPVEPGSCTQTFTASGNGANVSVPTGCFLEPQSINTIEVSGILTASPSSQSTCCVVTTYPESGTYGPLGGGEQVIG